MLRRFDTSIAAGVDEAAAVAALHLLACLGWAGCQWAGAVRAGALAGKAEAVAAVRSMHNVLGGTIDPHAAYLMLRGMKTLDVRVQRQNQVWAPSVVSICGCHRRISGCADSVCCLLLAALPSCMVEGMYSSQLDLEIA